MVDHANQIILARYILRRQKLKVLHMIAQVVVVERELNQGLLLTPPSANLLETLQLNREYGRWSENLERLLMRAMTCALAAESLVIQLLNVVELIDTTLE